MPGASAEAPIRPNADLAYEHVFARSDVGTGPSARARRARAHPARLPHPRGDVPLARPRRRVRPPRGLGPMGLPLLRALDLLALLDRTGRRARARPRRPATRRTAADPRRVHARRAELLESPRALACRSGRARRGTARPRPGRHRRTARAHPARLPRRRRRRTRHRRRPARPLPQLARGGRRIAAAARATTGRRGRARARRAARRRGTPGARRHRCTGRDTRHTATAGDRDLRPWPHRGSATPPTSAPTRALPRKRPPRQSGAPMRSS